MDTRYLFDQTEDTIYALWEAHDVFNPDTVKKIRTSENSPTQTKSFSIVMPPPNANDPLHVGHALFVSLEDIMIRYNRMLGNDTVWIPGTDHAGIETQFVFEKKLKSKGQSRFNFDRSTLFQMIWDYVQENSGVAVDQIKQLGASADWSRFKFTLDPSIVDSVLNTFISLNKNGLIYRDLKLVNYCTNCGTSYSELEVDHVEQVTKLYYIKYGPFVLATTRPETKFADTAVAVHPDDSRYQKYIDTDIVVSGLNGDFNLKVIADEYVDPEFGTGVVKITPYHDFNDFEVWKRHEHEIPAPQQVVGHDGKLTAIAGKYAGLRVKAARIQIEKDLQEKGLLEKVNDTYTHSIGVCYRCKQVIEPLPLPQFFVKVKDQKNNLVSSALHTLDTKQTKIHGAGREKILRHWLENLKDWNISRQIVWGISIPVWYQIDGYEDKVTIGLIDSEGKFKSGLLSSLLQEHTFEFIKSKMQQMSCDISVPYSVSLKEPTNSGQYLQETDTFDTWFSSSQWPVVTLNHSADDFARFYPTTVMETAYDILLFWVMRMMLLGIYMTDETPFAHVYLHGLIRDDKGQKMSKSKGNVINPLEIKKEFSADALRMALVIRSTAGLDKSVGKPDFKAMRNLTNKIWNASRFVLMQQEDVSKKDVVDALSEDLEVYKKLTEVTATITQQLDDYKIGLAAETLHNEFWHWYCDNIIELNKQGKVSHKALLDGLLVFLKLLHPFMPFVTEAIWQELVTLNLVSEKLLVTANWPKTLL